MVVVGGVALGARALGGSVGVADHVRTLRDRLVHREAQVREAVAVGLDEHELALRAERADHLEVERHLLRPSAVVPRVGRTAPLVDLPEAPVRGRARRQPERRAVDAQVGLGGGVIEGVDDRHLHRLDRLAGGKGQGVHAVGYVLVLDFVVDGDAAA